MVSLISFSAAIPLCSSYGPEEKGDVQVMCSKAKINISIFLSDKKLNIANILEH